MASRRAALSDNTSLIATFSLLSFTDVAYIFVGLLKLIDTDVYRSDVFVGLLRE